MTDKTKVLLHGLDVRGALLRNGLPPSVEVVDSPTPVPRPNAETVIWLQNSDNAIAGDVRFAEPVELAEAEGLTGEERIEVSRPLGGDEWEALLVTTAKLVTPTNPVQVTKTDGNFNIPATAGTPNGWEDFDQQGTAASRPLDVVLPNMAVGDGFDFRPVVVINSATGGLVVNLAPIVDGTVVRHLFDMTFGFFPWVGTSGASVTLQTRSPRFTVQAGDLEADGSLRLRLRYVQNTNARTVNAVGGIPVWLEGRGPLGQLAPA